MEARIGNHHVRGHHRQTGRHHRSVHIMHLYNALNAEHVLTHRVQVQAVRGELHEHRGRLLHQAHRTRHNQRRNEQTGKGVRLVEAGQPNHDSRHNHAQRTQGVVEHLQERGTHIEVRVTTGCQYRNADSVRDQADHTKDQQLGAGHLRRGEQAMHALNRRVDTHRQQQHRLPEGGKHLNAAETPRAARGRRARHERSRRQRHQQARGIRNSMRRISQQRETSGDQRTDRLRQHNNDRQAERNQQARTHRGGVLRARGMRMIVPMMMPVVAVVAVVCVRSHALLLNYECVVDYRELSADSKIARFTRTGRQAPQPRKTWR